MTSTRFIRYRGYYLLGAGRNLLAMWHDVAQEIIDSMVDIDYQSGICRQCGY